ncbi:MAG: hypothetical protein ACFFDK_08125 [Promethearchaeota archaeon]
MLQYITDFWILKDSGIVLYHYQSYEEVDKNLFGAITIALNAYADILSKGGLSSFQFITKKFTFIKKQDIIFVGKSSVNAKEKNVKQELNEISEKFFAYYSTDFLNKWKGNISAFSDFEKFLAISH